MAGKRMSANDLASPCLLKPLRRTFVCLQLRHYKTLVLGDLQLLEYSMWPHKPYKSDDQMTGNPAGKQGKSTKARSDCAEQYPSALLCASQAPDNDDLAQPGGNQR